MSALEWVVDHVAHDLAWVEPEPVFVGGQRSVCSSMSWGAPSCDRPRTWTASCLTCFLAPTGGCWRRTSGVAAGHRTRTGPLCRYITPAGTLVDLMSVDPAVLGFSSRWYPAVVANAERRPLVTGRHILVPTPALLLACKLEAWESRGVADPYASKDLEDIAALLDGCRELEQSVSNSASDVRHWIAGALDRIEANAPARAALFGQLPRGGDADAQSRRVQRLMERLMQG